MANGSFGPVGGLSSSFGAANPQQDQQKVEYKFVSANRIVADILRAKRIEATAIDVPSPDLPGFHVDSNGNMLATSSTISGAISGATMDVPSAGVAGFHVDASGNLGVGGTTSTNGKFGATAAGSVTATDLRASASGTSGSPFTEAVVTPGSSTIMGLHTQSGHLHSQLNATGLLVTQIDADYTAQGATTSGAPVSVFTPTTLQFADATSAWQIGYLGAGLGGYGMARLSGRQTLVSGAWTFETVVTPAAISAQVDDYAPTGITTASRLRVTLGAGTQNMTGISAGQSDGRILILHNADTASTLTLKHNNAGSATANRFFLAANGDFTISPRAAVFLIYDGTNSKWVMAQQ